MATRRGEPNTSSTIHSIDREIESLFRLALDIFQEPLSFIVIVAHVSHELRKVARRRQVIRIQFQGLAARAVGRTGSSSPAQLDES
jgi:hypothetical protein